MFTFRFLYKNNYLLFLDRVFYTKEREYPVLLRILLRIKGHKKKVNFLIFKGFYTVAAALGGGAVGSFFFGDSFFKNKAVLANLKGVWFFKTFWILYNVALPLSKSSCGA